MNRYRWRTFGLELVMVAVALVVGFPVYVLVNLAVRAPSDTSSPIRADHLAHAGQLHPGVAAGRRSAVR